MIILLSLGIICYYTLMEYFYLIILGLFVGILSSFFGVGGGIIIVPTLISLFPQFTSQEIIAISLVTIFLNTIINNYHFYKKNLLPSKKTIKYLIIFCFFGAICGSVLVQYIDSPTLKRGFAYILILVVLKLLLYKRKEHKGQTKENIFKIAIIGLSGSLLSSLTGLGGGVIFIPLFDNLAKVPVKKISPYSNVAMMISVFFAIFPHIYYQNTKFIFSLMIFIGAFLSSPLGVWLNEKASNSVKRTLFSLILSISALKILLN